MPAVRSLLKATSFRADDQIIVIDNDGDLKPTDIGGVDVCRNEVPLSFAANANLGLRMARDIQADVMLLNNDIIFTKHWLSYLNPKPNVISVPYCNQDAKYAHGSLSLSFAMDLEEYDERQSSALESIAERHRQLFATSKFVDAFRPLIPFFCVHIPYAAMMEVGDFDEEFGRGGGEDVDYRLRAALAGISTEKVSAAFLLHFMGRSTWRSGEALDVTRNADENYRQHFVSKWGRAAAELFLAGGKNSRIIEEYGLEEEIAKNNVAAILGRFGHSIIKK